MYQYNGHHFHSEEMHQRIKNDRGLNEPGLIDSLFSSLHYSLVEHEKIQEIFKMLTPEAYQKKDANGINLALFIVMHNSQYNLFLNHHKIVNAIKSCDVEKSKTQFDTLAGLICKNNVSQNLLLSSYELKDVFLRSDHHLQDIDGNNLGMLLVSKNHKSQLKFNSEEIAQIISLGTFTQTNKEQQNVGMQILKNNFFQELHFNQKSLEKILKCCDFKQRDSQGNNLVMYMVEYNGSEVTQNKFSDRFCLSNQFLMESINQSNLVHANQNTGLSLGFMVASLNSDKCRTFNLPQNFLIALFQKVADLYPPHETGRNFNIGSFVAFKNKVNHFPATDLVKLFKKCNLVEKSMNHQPLMNMIVHNKSYELNLSTHQFMEVMDTYLQQNKNKVDISVLIALINSNQKENLNLSHEQLTSLFDKSDFIQDVKKFGASKLVSLIADLNEPQQLGFDVLSFAHMLEKHNTPKISIYNYAFYFYIKNSESSNISLYDMNEKFHVLKNKAIFSIREYSFEPSLQQKMETIYEALQLTENLEQKPKNKLKSL